MSGDDLLGKLFQKLANGIRNQSSHLRVGCILRQEGWRTCSGCLPRWELMVRSCISPFRRQFPESCTRIFLAFYQLKFDCMLVSKMVHQIILYHLGLALHGVLIRDRAMWRISGELIKRRKERVMEARWITDSAHFCGWGDRKFYRLLVSPLP